MKSETLDLIPNPCTLIVPPNIQSMITGIRLARIFPSGVCQLEYVDGNYESAHLTLDQLKAGRENFFALVSAVQKSQGPSTRGF